MRLPSRGRMLLVVFGGVVVLAGAVAWSVGITVGGAGLRPELITEIDGDTVRIYEFDEHGPLNSEGQPVQSLVFEGSQEEADAFIAEPQAEDRNYVVPALIIAVGVVIVIVALIPVRMTQVMRRPAVFVITVVVSLPFTLFLFALGLAVSQFVIFPTATLATGVIAALVAGRAAGRLAGDGSRTDIGAVAWRNLAWAIIPAAASPFLDVLSPGLLALVVVFYTALGATLLAFRHRNPDTSIPRDGRITAAWLGGTVIALVLIIMVASVFGLTGA